MPHIAVDYSANMETIADIAGLCDVLRLAAVDSGVFPTAGIRVRAFMAHHVSIADGDSKHGFVDISVRLRAGRTSDEKQRATQQIFAAAERFLTPVMTHHPVALSLELRDIDPAYSPQTNTIRDHLDRSKTDV
ncbi:MAG: 5-carboxymethyl-2-hydroxymuconate isomerase [Pseudomonadota bacterium]